MGVPAVNSSSRNEGQHWFDGYLAISAIDGEKGLQLEFSAPFAIVIPFYDRVALLRFFDSFGHFRGFLFRPKGLPIERRVGQPANMVVNAQLHGLFFRPEHSPVSVVKITGPPSTVRRVARI
jgi:hypothetical protein